MGALTAGLALAYVVRPMADEGGALGRLGMAIGVAIVAAIVIGLAGAPLRYRNWRYELRDDELDIREGAFTITRTVVPLSRVQRVRVERTLTSQLLGVATLEVHTAAGETSIPALELDVADELRDTIARRLKLPDDL